MKLKKFQDFKKLFEYRGDLFSIKSTMFDTPFKAKAEFFPNLKPEELFELVDYIANEFGEELLAIEKEGKYVDPFLGSGDYGCVFLLKNGRVLKITSDRTEIKVAKKLVKRTTKYLLNYYDIAELYNGDENLRYFAVIMDEIKPLEKIDGKGLWYNAYEFFKFLPTEINKRNIPNIKNEFLRKYYLSGDYKEWLDKYWDNLVGMVQELRKLKVVRPDLDNILNFGVKDDGTIVHIDIRDTEGRNKSLPDLGVTLQKVKKIDVLPIIKEIEDFKDEMKRELKY